MRDGQHLRNWVTERFREVLKESGVKWVEVRGSVDDKLDQVVAKHSLFGESWTRRIPIS